MTNPSLAVHDQLEIALVDKWLEMIEQGCVVVFGVQVLTINHKASEYLGLDPSELVGQNSCKLSKNLVDPMQLNLLLGASSLDGQTVSRCQFNGRERHLQIKAQWADNIVPGENKRYRLISITDVTAVVEAEQQIASHHRRWQAMNAGVVLVGVHTNDMPIVYVNPAFELMTGYSAKECVGRNCRFLQGHLHNQAGLDVIRDAIKAQRSGYAVLRNFRKDGSEFLNELFISPIYDESQKLTHFLGVQHLRVNDQTLTSAA